MPTAAGDVAEKGSEYIVAHTRPRGLDGRPLLGAWVGVIPVVLGATVTGSQFSYTTPFGKGIGQHKISALKIKSVRTRRRAILNSKNSPKKTGTMNGNRTTKQSPQFLQTKIDIESLQNTLKSKDAHMREILLIAMKCWCWCVFVSACAWR